MTLEEFAGEFFQDVLAEADAEGQFVEDVFFHRFCEHLMEAGELDSADRVAYQGQPGEAFASTDTEAIPPRTTRIPSVS